jgi:hypothetical protein
MRTIFIIFCAAVAFRAAAELDKSQFLLTSNEMEEVKVELDKYEKGQIRLDDLNEKGGQDLCRKLVGYYLDQGHAISVKAKLPISRCLGGFGMYSNALQLANEYVAANTNDGRGWRVVGNAYSYLKATNEAIRAYSIATHFGDDASCEALAGTALSCGRLEVIGPVIPKLLSIKSAKATPKEQKVEVTSLLLFYALKIGSNDIFLRAWKGITPTDIVQNPVLRKNLEAGCGFFEGNRKVQNFCSKFHSKIAQLK